MKYEDKNKPLRQKGAIILVDTVGCPRCSNDGVCPLNKDPKTCTIDPVECWQAVFLPPQDLVAQTTYATIEVEFKKVHTELERLKKYIDGSAFRMGFAAVIGWGLGNILSNMLIKAIWG